MKKVIFENIVFLNACNMVGKHYGVLYNKCKYILIRGKSEYLMIDISNLSTVYSSDYGDTVKFLDRINQEFPDTNIYEFTTADQLLGWAMRNHNEK